MSDGLLLFMTCSHVWKGASRDPRRVDGTRVRGTTAGHFWGTRFENAKVNSVLVLECFFRRILLRGRYGKKWLNGAKTVVNIEIFRDPSQ
ncbi:hypothetical protein TSAR_006364 [Trichomalopsis sarcophagae]|uniref:Uncharacterized protein n=1 Tax=Trichomalopsis sarcophagae TaxID=543379 RepID=A0A232EYA5_9HYME|nr:hypothetical protein TSAR_006364 [Trichomalopsis sarcophagae]